MNDEYYAREILCMRVIDLYTSGSNLHSHFLSVPKGVIVQCISKSLAIGFSIDPNPFFCFSDSGLPQISLISSDGFAIFLLLGAQAWLIQRLVKLAEEFL